MVDHLTRELTEIRGKKTPYKPALKMETHPLAYLLMLCDELQCWDRAAYGRKSRQIQYPSNASFEFSDAGLRARYLFMPELEEMINAYWRSSSKTVTTESTSDSFELKLYIEMQDPDNQFLNEISAIVNLTSMELCVETAIADCNEGRKHRYMSRKSFLNLYDLAVTLHTLKHKGWFMKKRESYYLSQSLEYQLSGINRAKAFAGFLDATGCFYSDRLLDNPEVKRFTARDRNTIAPLEHARWMREHINMGWHASEDEIKDKDIRELQRCHHLLLEGNPNDEDIQDHFHKLSEEEQEKDVLAFPKLKDLLKREGVRIYRMKRRR